MVFINNNRIVEKFSEETKTWIEIDFQHLNKKDTFRIFDCGKRYVNKEDGSNVWIATSEPYLNKNGIWQIDAL